MSHVLVSPPAIPDPMIPIVEVEELSTPQLHLSAVNFAVNLARDHKGSAASSKEKRMASQLAYLASQHHTSEYNKLKFGPAGAPMMYIPLSIQMPTQVQEMRRRQTLNAQKQMWWPAEPVETHLHGRVHSDPIQIFAQGCSLEPPQQENVVPSIEISSASQAEVPVSLRRPAPPLNHPPTLNLRREISVAMSSPLLLTTIPQLSSRDSYQQLNSDIHTKTSESHPINISSIIPFELLPLISSHLIPTPPHTAYMFDLPASLFLSSAAMHISTPHSTSMRPCPITRTFSEGPWNQPIVARPPPVSFPRVLKKPLLNGISELPVTVDEWRSTKQNEHDPKPDYSIPAVDNGSECTPQPPTQTVSTALPSSSADPDASHNDSLLVPTSQTRPHSAPPSFISSLTSSEVLINGIAGPPLLPELVDAMSSDILNNNYYTGRSENSDIQPLSASHSADVSPIIWTHTHPPSFVPSIPVLGNMLLSSCPGKKVRLNGPVKGRGAICRDLGHDLKRVKALGVRCIICCLDDEELDFLGASWLQYSQVARQIGLDVLRIPIPEGLGPVNPAQLDGNLSHVIHSYTMKGIPILVHCRGGVGRAGLVACCWMLKLGLCGWLPLSTTRANDHVQHQENDSEMAKVPKETINLVERVIAVVRQRRSVKAIETYEQVRFLVEFVEYLQMSGERVS